MDKPTIASLKNITEIIFLISHRSISALTLPRDKQKGYFTLPQCGRSTWYFIQQWVHAQSSSPHSSGVDAQGTSLYSSGVDAQGTSPYSSGVDVQDTSPYHSRVELGDEDTHSRPAKIYRYSGE